MHDDQPHTTQYTRHHAMSNDEARAEADRIIAEALREEARVPTATRFHDDTPHPQVGDTPPVPQHGRPPMSQKATDTSVIVLSVGVASVPVGGMTSLILYTLGNVDPVNLALGVGAPVAFILAVGTLLRRLHGVHTEHHHHYDGATVHQDHSNVTTTTKGVFARTNNRLD